MTVERVLLVRPRGFCAGVERAIASVEAALSLFREPVYVRKHIVHNSHVVQHLTARGAIFVDHLSEVPDMALVIFSAHGVSPEVRREAQSKALRVIDATCPLVTKVHLEAIRYARQGYFILLIGHPGHDEVIGTLGEVPESTFLISTVADAETVSVPDASRVAAISQTTLSVDDTKAILTILRGRFPGLATPPKEDICYATQNRQQGVKVLAHHCQLILVMGSANSANSARLAEIATQSNVPSFLIDDALAIQERWLKSVSCVGITSGASCPERIVSEVVSYFRGLGVTQFDELDVVPEAVSFALPNSLRQYHPSSTPEQKVSAHDVTSSSKKAMRHNFASID